MEMMLKFQTVRHMSIKFPLSSVMIDRIISNNFMQVPKYPNDNTQSNDQLSILKKKHLR